MYIYIFLNNYFYFLLFTFIFYFLFFKVDIMRKLFIFNLIYLISILIFYSNSL